jgi:hypothetical protein
MGRYYKCSSTSIPAIHRICGIDGHVVSNSLFQNSAISKLNRIARRRSNLIEIMSDDGIRHGSVSLRVMQDSCRTGNLYVDVNPGSGPAYKSKWKWERERTRLGTRRDAHDRQEEKEANSVSPKARESGLNVSSSQLVNTGFVPGGE